MIDDMTARRFREKVQKASPGGRRRLSRPWGGAAQGQPGHVGPGHLKVMSAIETCRTIALGGHVERCEHCAQASRLSRYEPFRRCRPRPPASCSGCAQRSWRTTNAHSSRLTTPAASFNPASKRSRIIPPSSLLRRGTYLNPQDFNPQHSSFCLANSIWPNYI
jgi:hypothetical protein